MKLLHVLAPARFGGLEQVVRLLAAGLAAHDHEVDVAPIVDSTDHPFLQHWEGTGVHLHPITVGAHAYLTQRRLLSDLLQRRRPDLVHTHGYRSDVLDSRPARALKLPVVATSHGFTGGGARMRVYEAIQRFTFRRLDAVVAVSRAMGRGLVRSGVPEARVHVIPNAWRAQGMDALARAAARAAMGVHDDTPVIGWVGRLSQEKGPDVLVDSLAGMTDVPWTAVVIGDGPMRAACEAQAQALGLAHRVRWLGAVDRASRLFAAFDVFVISSRTEGTPMALFEAMHADVPVVTTAVGGIPDVVTAAEALLVQAEDAAALRAALTATLQQPEAAAARAHTARLRLERDYDVDRWIDRYVALYHDVVSARGKPAG